MRKKKTTTSRSFQGLNFDDLKWCIDNDFQVYVQPVSEEKRYEDGRKYYQLTGEFKIAVRRGGISSQGKDVHKDEVGRVFKSKLTLSEKTFDKQSDAEAHLNYTYNYLRRKYGGGS